MKEATWTILPTGTPSVVRHCNKCNKKMAFYCSEKFRLNGNHTKIDIWLIYKCIKCDTTWKLTLKKGIKPHDIPAERFNRFTNNDKALAWEYAFNRTLLKQMKCDVQYNQVEYTIDGYHMADVQKPQLVHIHCPFPFDLKLVVLLAYALKTSVTQIKKLVDEGSISTSMSGINILKYRFNSTDVVHIDIRC